MLRLIRVALGLLLIVAVTGVASGQVQIQEENTNIGTASAEFLNFGAGARGMALGGSFSALVRDVEALYYNPAGLPLMDGFQTMVTVMPYFADTDYYWMGLAFPFGAGQYAIGVSLGNFGFSDQRIYTEADPEGEEGRTYGVSETFVSLSFAHAFIDRFTGGLTLKFIVDELGQTQASGFAIDFGTNFHTEVGGRPIALAVVIQNLGSSLEHSGTGLDFTAFPESLDPEVPVSNVDESPARFQTQAFALPTTFRVGLAYDVVSNAANRVSLLSEFVESNFQDPTWGFAGEYEWSGPESPISASLRGSYNYQPDNSLSEAERAAGLEGLTDAENDGLDGLALGGGLKYRFAQRYQARFDYTYRHFGVLGNSNTFSLGFAVVP